MAESYISELGDKLSHGVANTDGSRVKIIAPKLYTDGNSHPSIATALAGKAASSHTHGNIQNGGTLQSSDVAIANGDKLVVTDASDSNKVARTSVTFDGTGTGAFLAQKGTWEYPKEAYLAWGGRNISAGYTPVDAALVDVLGANRFAFANPAGVTIEYTRDGGTTWTDYGASDAAKIELLTATSGQSSFTLGKSDSSHKATSPENRPNYKLRVTFTAPAIGVYADIRKFVLLVSTNGSRGCQVTVRTITRTNEEAGGAWVNRGTASLGGWSGWNVLNLGTTYTPWSGSSGQKDQCSKIEFLFEATTESSESDQAYNGFSLIRMLGYSSSPAWRSQSTLASTGHLYAYDSAKNATFPARVTATEFSGPLTGNASSATKATQDSDGNAINATYFKSSGNVTLVSGTATKIGTQNGTDVKLTLPSIPTYNFSGTTFYSGNQSNAEHNADNIKYNGVYYWTSNGPTPSLGMTDKGSGTSDGAIFAQAYGTTWVGQIAQDYRNGNLFVRGMNNGTWQSWLRIPTASAKSVGNSTTPVYMAESGQLTALSYTIAKSVPSDAVFTDTKVKATAKTDNVNYKILATASASPTSGNATEAVYDADITLNPSTNTIAANITGTSGSVGSLLYAFKPGTYSNGYTHLFTVDYGTVKKGMCTFRVNASRGISVVVAINAAISRTDGGTTKAWMDVEGETEASTGYFKLSYKAASDSTTDRPKYEVWLIDTGSSGSAERRVGVEVVKTDIAAITAGNNSTTTLPDGLSDFTYANIREVAASSRNVYTPVASSGTSYYLTGVNSNSAGWLSPNLMGNVKVYQDSGNGWILYVGNAAGTSGTPDKGRLYLSTGKGANVKLAPNGSLDSSVDIILPSVSGTLTVEDGDYSSSGLKATSATNASKLYNNGNSTGSKYPVFFDETSTGYKSAYTLKNLSGFYDDNNGAIWTIGGSGGVKNTANGGHLRICNGLYTSQLYARNLTANRVFDLPDYAGTVLTDSFHAQGVRIGGTNGTGSWFNFAEITMKEYLNHPFVIRLNARGMEPVLVYVLPVNAANKVASLRIKAVYTSDLRDVPEANTIGQMVYTYTETDNVRTYKLWVYLSAYVDLYASIDSADDSSYSQISLKTNVSQASKPSNSAEVYYSDLMKNWGTASFDTSVTGTRRVARLSLKDSQWFDATATFSVHTTGAGVDANKFSFRGILTVCVRNSNGAYTYGGRYIGLSTDKITLSVKYDTTTHQIIVFATKSNTAYAAIKLCVMSSLQDWGGNYDDALVTMYTDANTEDASGYSDISIVNQFIPMASGTFALQNGDYSGTGLKAASAALADHATYADSLPSTAVGNYQTPVYIKSDGKPETCTSLNLNTSGAAGSINTGGVRVGNEYAPVFFENTGKPVVCTLSGMSVGSASTASKLANTSKIGDTNKPVYFTANGVPAVCTSLSLNVTGNLTGNADTASALVVPSQVGSDSRPVYFTAQGTPSICGYRFLYGCDSSGTAITTQYRVCIGSVCSANNSISIV